MKGTGEMLEVEVDNRRKITKYTEERKVRRPSLPGIVILFNVFCVSLKES